MAISVVLENTLLQIQSCCENNWICMFIVVIMRSTAWYDNNMFASMFAADVLISRQKHQLDEIISLKEQVSEIAHLKSEFLALKTELAEVKEQNKRYENNLSELITYSIFHTKSTKAQEETCFIVRREAEKVFSLSI